MTVPWSNPPRRSDYQAAAGILVQMSQGRSAVTLLDAIQKGETTVIPNNVLAPPAVVNVTDDYVLLAVSGTQNYLQWICHFLGSNQVGGTEFPGSVNAYFAATTSSLLGALVDFIPALQTRRLVLIGHSFGAAIVQLVATKWQSITPRGVVTICFGSPRVGDEAFANAATFPAYRVQGDGDPVPSFPPVNWVGTGVPWTGFVGLNPATYVHGGVVVSLATDGTLGSTDNTMSFTDAVTAVTKGAFDPHAIEEYQRRLMLIADPPVDQWKDPATVEEILDWQAIFFNPALGNQGGGAVALIQGIMYFRTSEETGGWGESWCATTDINGMLAKLAAVAPVRALTLASSCEIHAFKAANIDLARLTNQSRSILLDSPIPGKASGTSIKDTESTLTNEDMDAIDYEIISSAQSSRRIFPFRGVPDSWISGSKRSGVGIGADKKFLAYIAACKTANFGFKVYDRANAKEPITAITNDPASLSLKITSAGHGLEDRQIVIIRGLKVNPMVNGRWRVSVVDPNNFLLVGSSKFNASATGVGTWQLFNTVADTIEDQFFNSVSTRKIGRVFGQRRGKRSARLLHH